jgi:hypothetical protein
MDDMTAFERQLSGEVSGLMGPVRPVDDLAVYESVTAANQQSRWGSTMFSALRFVAASAIVALFGGFLMAGVLTTQPSDDSFSAAVSASPSIEATTEPTEADTTSVRSDVLPGVELTVEEAEPGVYRVLDDGVRDLVLGGNTDIVAGHDDGIWLLRKNQFVRLGSEAGHGWPKEGGRYHSDFEVTPEGTVWVIKSDYRNWYSKVGDVAERGTLFSSDGDGWVRTRLPHELLDIAVAPEGTLWASWGAAPPVVRYLGPSGWQRLDDETGSYFAAHRLHPIDSGAIYTDEPFGGFWVYRYEDGAWTRFLDHVQGFDAAPDGTVWVLGELNLAVPEDFAVPEDIDEAHALIEWREGLPTGESALARLAGGAWEWWEPDDLPDMGLGIALEGGSVAGIPYDTFMAAPDGSLWASLWQRGPDGDDPAEAGLWTVDDRNERERYDPQCDGLVRFDGESADRFLPGRCITMDIAADGSVWVLADGDRGRDLYVITPEAVAASN